MTLEQEAQGIRKAVHASSRIAHIYRHRLTVKKLRRLRYWQGISRKYAPYVMRKLKRLGLL